jgi:hypothetical protein
MFNTGNKEKTLIQCSSENFCRQIFDGFYFVPLPDASNLRDQNYKFTRFISPNRYENTLVSQMIPFVPCISQQLV